MVDTYAVRNKYGSEDIGRFYADKFKNNTKLSIVINKHNIPIDCKITAGSTSDLRIFKTQIDTLGLNNTVILADKAYASKKVNIKLSMSQSRVITPPKKNTNTVLSEPDRILFRQRGAIERFFARVSKFKQIAMRYDRYTNYFESYVYMTFVLISIENNVFL
jgi:transposase